MESKAEVDKRFKGVFMATRDRSSGIGFVQVSPNNNSENSNVYELFKRAAAASNQIQNSRVLRGDDIGKVHISKYQAPTFVKNNNPSEQVEDLKNNIRRLQDLHGKLRFMLKELEDLVGKKE